jgi:hypothetical protein
MAIVAIPGHAPPAHLLSARMARLRNPVIPRPTAPSVALHMSAAPLALTAAVALPTLVVAVGDTHIVRWQSTDLENPGCGYSPGFSLLANLSLCTVPLSHPGFTPDNSFRRAVLDIVKQGS